ncbi:sodium ABC transporter permease [Lysobacter arseniciresistens ZS79]|uniref:Sodium ABC transporter permease n=1 Tax=Lysobacter arseniciresistens ZS79 TaxID=913325 RepID=A0A0A0F2H2_9GAMM|nr:ABC transporter permease [Lysobacter arseniciresistens]KGM56740.1 sodium ABC transporter permease [Lysobacter arseniciresistens ZS79]
MSASSTFTQLWAVAVKELRDFARDRRTLALTLLMGPLLYPAIMLGLGTMAESRARTQLDEPLEIPVVGAEHAPHLVAFLAGHGIEAADELPADVDAAVREQTFDVALSIDAQFGEDWRAGRPARVDVIHDSTRRTAEIPVKRLRAALQAYAGQVGALRLYARGIDATVTQPIALGSRDLATPEAKRGVLLSMLLPYLLILMSFLGGAYLIMDATAGERERQSLEPLLATPASRGAIVSGKMVAACLVGIASLLLTLLAFKLSAQFAGGTAQMLDVRFSAIAKLLLILLPMLFIGTTLLSYLSAASKSMKEAQSHMTWLMLLPMLPIMLLAVNPLKYEPWQFAVPFLAQNQMIQKVIRAEPVDPQTWTIYLVAGFGLAALLWFAAVRRYHQEKLAISG